MKKTISSILICLSLILAFPANAKKSSRKQQKITLTTDTTFLTDSLTGIRLSFPPGAMAVRDSAQYIMLKYSPTHYVSAYTWHNKNDKPYDWQALSSLDKEPFDNIIRQTRVDGEERDGWHRLYHFPTTNPPHYLLTTLIRGNRDAMMIIEAAVDTTEFITPTILDASAIPSYTLTPKISEDTAWMLGIGWVIVVMAIVWFCKTKLRKKEGFVWGLIAANFIACFLVCYFILDLTFGQSALGAFLLSLLPALYVYSGRWSALIQNILSNLS